MEGYRPGSDNFHLTMPSDSDVNDVFGNTNTDFRIPFQVPLHILPVDDWEVGLSEVFLPGSLYNVDKDMGSFLIWNKSGQTKRLRLRPGFYTAESFVRAVNFTIAQSEHSFLDDGSKDFANSDGKLHGGIQPATDGVFAGGLSAAEQQFVLRGGNESRKRKLRETTPPLTIVQKKQLLDERVLLGPHDLISTTPEDLAPQLRQQQQQALQALQIPVVSTRAEHDSIVDNTPMTMGRTRITTSLGKTIRDVRRGADGFLYARFRLKPPNAASERTVSYGPPILMTPLQEATTQADHERIIYSGGFTVGWTQLQTTYGSTWREGARVSGANKNEYIYRFSSCMLAGSGAELNFQRPQGAISFPTPEENADPNTYQVFGQRRQIAISEGCARVLTEISPEGTELPPAADREAHDCFVESIPLAEGTVEIDTTFGTTIRRCTSDAGDRIVFEFTPRTSPVPEAINEEAHVRYIHALPSAGGIGVRKISTTYGSSMVEIEGNVRVIKDLVRWNRFEFLLPPPQQASASESSVEVRRVGGGTEPFFSSKLHFDKDSKRIFFELEEGERITFLNKGMRFMMGFGMRDKHTVSLPMAQGKALVGCRYPTQFDFAYQFCYVYCDIVSNVAFNSNLMHVLRVVAISEDEAGGPLIHKIYTEPEYHKVQVDRLADIGITLRDHMGRALNLQRGAVNIKLHFRRRRH